MRGLLLVGGLAAGVIFFIYDYFNRNNHHGQSPHGYGGSSGGDEDFIDLGSVEPAEVRRRLGPNRALPTQEEVCSICLDKLIRRDADSRYCIMALPECGHWFHQKCAIRLLEYHPMCPICRASIDGTRLRGTPVRVLQASDVEMNQTRQPVVNGLDSLHPVAGCSGSTQRKPVDYQPDDDLD